MLTLKLESYLIYKILFDLILIRSFAYNFAENSKSKYEKQYQLFSDWCGINQVTNITEQVLLEYFNEKSKVYNSKSSTLWAVFSMLRTELIEKNGLDIKTYTKLLAFLKQQAVGYKPKKSKILRKSEIYKFLAEAPDKKYLMKKVILIFGVAGACLGRELVNLSIDDIEDQKSIVIVKIPDNKTRTTRTFLLQNYGENAPDLLSYYRKYASLRPSSLETRRFFIKYSNGVCKKQAAGIHAIGKIPREVASYLGLLDCDAYTTHCFRRSSQYFLAYDGENLLNRKSFSDLKSTPVAEDHIENSKKVSSVGKRIFCDIMGGPSSTDCAVLNCKSKRKNGARMFKCCNVYDNYKLWIQNCQFVLSSRKPNLICSQHFEPQCFLNGKLKRSAVPTLFLPNQANVSTSSEIYNLQNGVPAEDIDKINSNQETEYSEFESDEEADSIKAHEFIPTASIKKEPNVTLEVVKREPSVSFSDYNSSSDDTEANSSINEESSDDESPMRQDFQFCNTNSSTTCNCSNKLIQLENNQEEIKMKLDQLLELVRDITIRN